MHDYLFLLEDRESYDALIKLLSSSKNVLFVFFLKIFFIVVLRFLICIIQ